MTKLYIEFDNRVPRIVYTGCNQCNSDMGISLCSVKNRGCCSYFPKFSLYEIHRMSKSLQGLRTLDKIISHPGTRIDMYKIYTTGSFEKDLYDEFINGDTGVHTSTITDKTILFKTCPFVKGGHGCTLSPAFRTTVCNFFLCTEILDLPEYNEALKPYVESRADYMKFVYRENLEIEHLLYEHNINLNTNFNETINFLQELPLNDYDYPELAPVNIENANTLGA